MASVLGIDITRVKIVSVYEGSLNVDVQILDNTSLNTQNPDQTQTTSVATVTEMTGLKAKLVQTLTTASPTTLGAPVLEVQAVQLTQYVAPATTTSTSGTSASSTVLGSLSGDVAIASILVPGGAMNSLVASMVAVGAVLLTALF